MSSMKRFFSSFRNYLTEAVEYDENQYEFSARLTISKDVGGNREQTFAEIRAIDDITIVKQVPHSGDDDDSNFYSTMIVRFIPPSSREVTSTLEKIIEGVRLVNGVLSVHYKSDLKKISGQGQ